MELVMERRLLLSALLSVCVLWRICSASHTDHHKQLNVLQDRNVIDILEMLSTTQSSRGIAKVKGPAPGTAALRFHFHTPHLTFPLDVYQRFRRAWHGSLSLHLAGQQAGGAVATLLSLSAPGNTPLLRVISSMQEDFLQLEIHMTPNTKPEVLRIPGGNPFSGGRWARVVLGVAPGWVWMFHECKEATIVKLTHQGRPLTLHLPPHDLQVTLAKTADDKVSKFSGYLETAQISTTPYERRPWFCKNVTDPVPFPPAPYSSVDSEEELQDQPEHTVNLVLGPPASPHVREQRTRQRRQGVRNLEERLHNITAMLLMLKQQNEDLQARVRLLETCECVRKTCVWENQEMKEGSRWRTDRHTECSCISGRVQCETSKKCGEGDIIHNVSYSTVDGCQTCSCRNGDVSCVDLQKCPRSCQNGVKPPFGSCCRDCSRCEYRGEVVPEGVTFTDHEDPCKVCVCSGGNVMCSSVPCPTPDCSLVETVSGECCPRCRSCVHEGVQHEHSTQWPNPRDPCSVCTCSEGRVACTTSVCDTPCRNPVPSPGTCCPTCDHCSQNGQNFRNGEPVPSRDRCERCVCENGNINCEPLPCPTPHCSHPIRRAGDCCPRCEQCTYESEVFSDGEQFTSKKNPCLSCWCSAGEVMCESRESLCPPVRCTNPTREHGTCCPTCNNCVVHNLEYRDGEQFVNPVHQCEQCVCQDGQVECHNQCPRPQCNYPVTGTCCQNNCNGCSYAGKDYPNGMEFPHPTDPCRECHCLNGNVQCRRIRCPPVKCSEPIMTQGQCCPQCPAPLADCVHEGNSYRHTQRFSHPTDSCQLCSCTNEMVNCHRKPCPSVSCTHPVQRECCRTCDGCLINGVERANGEQFADASDPCVMCTCREGSVACVHRTCPRATCPFPVQGECCPSCDGCHYAGVDYSSGQEFLDPADRCKHCTCLNGHVTCSQRPCYSPGCSHPAPSSGHCCPVCDACSYDGEILLNGQSIPDRTEPCSECTCRSGSVQCVRRLCSAAPCPNPVTGPCGCPVCEGCSFETRVYKDGEAFSAPDAACTECTCSRGEVRCSPKSCPSVACLHPAQDSCRCAECNHCRYRGRDYKNREHFPHPEDNCQRCTCLNGDVSCTAVPCLEVSCRRPVRPPGACCPVCRGVCEYMGQEYQSGSTFRSPTDTCSICTCQNEDVSCQRKPCPQQCTHSALYSDCCPVCDACLYEDVQYTHAQRFRPRSNACIECVCERGSVTCNQVPCPISSCHNPVTPSGQCCPECRGCVHNGIEYTEGKRFRVHTDHCSECVCQNGEMSCAQSYCAPLKCMHQVTDPDSCCPRCRGCVYDGVEHSEGSTWFASSSPCMSCMCVDGVTTCSEIQCLSPCINKISVPGECCPLCADCIYEGRVYGPRESFHPSDDPCQICTCEVMPDGQQHLRCYRKQCPRLVDCPKNNIMFSSPDSCCPVCAQPLSICTEALIGNEVLATDDPCFTCQCKDLTWTCVHKSCPLLSCPPDEQYTPPDSCCPVCDVCVVEGGRRRVNNGQRWTDSEDECITCSCKLGHIECNIEECAPLVCEVGMLKVKSPGKCCYECQANVRAQCVYEGQAYDSNVQWDVDECTSCTCVSGDVHCQTERCPAVSCASDETPSVIPGMCCPRCIPRPATCIVFGDPHYRTFDGKMVNFQGTCTYVLAQDCEGGNFSVHVTNDDRGRKGVSWTKEVTVYIRDIVIQLLQDWVVKVDRQTITLPFLKEPYIYLERKSNTILLNTNVGMKVMWNGRSHLEVSVPGTYKKHMCGLCGNFNNYPQDDMQLRNGQIATSETTFGNNWKVVSGNDMSTRCADARDIDPCKVAGYSFRKTANSRCAVLKSAVFERCHRVVPPEMFFASCVYDLCACAANADECLCDALEAYASECREAGVVLQWRSPSLCAVGCPVDRGYVFDECGPPCPKTCLNKDVPLGVIEAHCFKPCVPGCQCPAGLVEHESHCISPEKCPKIIHGNP
ncbi:kielin/chordin-like protein isoform X1 [Ictalurus punctatus]|uniref:Kielin/chordin-like protein isoform X1 n=1 Tax=Ictalurus punctatus TaxID=7998 RepID=A0A9F7R5H3_ICTPU|nr:kielin/chordin-like protein isoform X1 [Ictalurus punctatus]